MNKKILIVYNTLLPFRVFEKNNVGSDSLKNVSKKLISRAKCDKSYK